MISIINIILSAAMVYGHPYNRRYVLDDQYYDSSGRNECSNRYRREYSEESDEWCERSSYSSDSSCRNEFIIEISEEYEDRRGHCRPRPFTDCRPVCRPLPECRPVCNPLPECRPRPRPLTECRPVCKPVHHKKKKTPRRCYPVNINLYITLINRVLAQGSFEVHKLSRYYSDDIKTKLLEGLQLALKSAGTKAFDDLKKLERKIIDTVVAHNKNILRDTKALVTLTNGDILDNLVAEIKLSNKDLIRALIAFASAPDPDPPVNGDAAAAAILPIPALPPISLAAFLSFVNPAFEDLIDNLPNLFKKPVQNEKNALQRIVNENRNNIIKDVTRLVEDFEVKLSKFFADLAEDELRIVRGIIDQSSRKLLCDLEHLIHQIGQNIISILKGCNTTFRPYLQFGPEYGGWTNVNESELLFN